MADVAGPVTIRNIVVTGSSGLRTGSDTNSDGRLEGNLMWHGYGPEVHLVHRFQQLGLHRAALGTFETNERAIVVFKKVYV